MPGTDFASAELIDSAENINEFLAVGSGEHYYRFVVSDASNSIEIVGYQWADTYSNRCEIEIYDGSEVLIKSQNNTGYDSSTAHTLSNLATGTYYIVVFGSSSFDLHYNMTFWMIENGVQPSPLHTDMEYFDQIRIVNDQIWEAEGEVNYFDAIVLVDDTVPGYALDTPNTEFDYEIHGDFVRDFQNPIVYDFKKTNVVFGNQNLAQHTIKGTVKREGVSVQNGLLRLYDRTSGELIEETRSDNAGTYEFRSVLDPDFKYYIVAFDDVDTPILQAVIHDFLDPILETI